MIDKKILYLAGCIPIRICIAILAVVLSKQHLQYYGYVLMMPAIGFLMLYFGNLRLDAPEAGGKTWWANLRIIHGLLYLTASVLAIQQNNIAWVPLAIDVIFGLLAFINHHYLNIL